MNLEKLAREYLKEKELYNKSFDHYHIGNYCPDATKVMSDFTKQTAPKLRYNERGEVVSEPDDLLTNIEWGQAKTPEQLFSEIEAKDKELKEFRSAMIDYHLNEIQKEHPHPSVADANAWIEQLLK